MCGCEPKREPEISTSVPEITNPVSTSFHLVVSSSMASDTTPTDLQIRAISGSAIEPYLPELVRLRITVFREFPYLYDGDADYEARYLRKYAASDRSIFVLALSDDAVVGVSTGVPLLEADADFQAPFKESEFDLSDVFYFGESVLERAFRGKGAGHRFFDEREAFAKRLGYNVTTFCAVVRPHNHPERPSGYRPLNDFWQKRGYTQQPDIIARYGWKETGQEEETEQEMVFWVKEQG